MILNWSDIKKILDNSASSKEKVLFERWLSHSRKNREYFEKIKFFYNNTELAIKENEQQRGTKHSANYILNKYKFKKRAKFVFLTISSIASVVIAINFIFLKTQLSNQSLEKELIVNNIAAPQSKLEKNVKIIKDNGEELLLNQITSSSNNIEVNNLSAEITYSSKETIDFSNKKGGKTVEYHTIYIPSKQDYTLTLSDGTKIKINSGSQLRYPTEFIEGEERKVYLSGEAYFEVTHNNEDGFIVGVDNIEVKVYGTTFNINSFEEDIETVLVEGSVALKIGEGEFKLKPNQIAKVSKLNENLCVDSVDVSRYISWIDGYLSFKDTPMKEITKILSRYYDAQIVFDNNAAEQQLFSGYIDKSLSLDDILKAISRTDKIKYHQNNGQYLIW